MENPRDFKYTNEHEWVSLEGDLAVVGLTNYAATQLGDMVYVDMPTVNAEVGKGDSIGALESVKAAADFYSPISGQVVARNERLLDDCRSDELRSLHRGVVDPIKPTDLSEVDELMDAAAYDEFEKSQG